MSKTQAWHFSRRQFSKSSEKNLEGVHPDLVRICRRALELSNVDFGILDGCRTVAEEAKYVASGASQTMHSRHLTGHAVDFGAYVDGHYINGDTAEEYKLYERIANAFKVAALEMTIPIVWGGDWKTIKDGGHIELARWKYPA